MSEKIEPALTAEEWAALRKDGPLALIALSNDELPDSDPRKITREMLFCLREVIANFRAAYETAGGDNPKIAAQYAPAVEQLADALESYLPPE